MKKILHLIALVLSLVTQITFAKVTVRITETTLDNFYYHQTSFMVPQNLQLSNSTINENLPTGTLIGTLSADNSVYPNGTLNYYLTDEYNNDNNNFKIVDNQLLANRAFNYEVKRMYNISIGVFNQLGESVTKEFQIDITDVIEENINIIEITDATLDNVYYHQTSFTVPTKLVFTNLTSVTGYVYFHQNTNLVGVEFPALTQTGEYFYVNGNQSLISVDIPVLTQTVGYVYITGNQNLESVKAPILNTIHDKLYVTGNTKLSVLNICGLKNILPETKYYNTQKPYYYIYNNTPIVDATPCFMLFGTPIASAQTFCDSATVASLVATGTGLKWYNSSTASPVLASYIALASGTYYVSQTINETESLRTAVEVTITPSTTTGSVTTLIFAGDSYTWHANGITYTTAQTGLTYISGCNTATLNLTITPLPNTQETIFNENFGDGGPGAQAALRTITTYYAGTATDTFQSAYPIVYSGEAVIGTLYTATVENYNLAGNQVTGANLTTSNYLNSTGTGFAVMTNRTNEFKIENINTSNRANIILSFGLRVGKNQNSYTNYLKLEQSIDGVTWTPISFLAPPPNQWAYITCTTKLLSNEFLKLRFTQEISTYDTQGWGTTSIDDIKITGMSSSLNIGNYNIGSFKIYPNPVSNVITIDCGNINNIANQAYTITDALGKIVLKGKLNDGETAINVEHLSKGIYCIKIANNKASKFIKE
jgi:hypothetical protein